MVKKQEKKQVDKISIKAQCSREDWKAFKEMVKPIPVEVALGQMIRTAIESETKPFKEIVEGLLKNVFRS